LSDSQLSEWSEALKHIKSIGEKPLDEVYKKLYNSRQENILPYLARLNPVNTLEMDIVREYVSNLDNEDVEKYEVLSIIKEVLKSKMKYPTIKLKDILTEYKNFIKIEDDNRYKQLTISNTGEVKLRSLVMGEEIATKRQNQIIDDGSEYLIYSRLGLHTGSIGYVPFWLMDSIVSIDFPVFKSSENIRYISYILQSQIFINKIIEKNPTGAAQQRFHQDDFLEFEVSLPDAEEQASIVAQIEKQRMIIEGIDKVLDNWEIDFHISKEWERKKLNDVCNKIFTGNTPSNKVTDEGEIQFLKVNNLSFNLSLNKDKEFFISEAVLENEMKNLMCYPDDVLMNIVGPPMGKVTIIPNDLKVSTINQNIICFRSSDKLLPRYLGYFLLRRDTTKTLIEDKRGVVGQWFVNKTMCSNIEIPLPDMKTQGQIVSELDTQIQILEGLHKLKAQAQIKINKILADVWGIKYVEPLILEDKDE
jgi:restriction endonuclease S subunit